MDEETKVTSSRLYSAAVRELRQRHEEEFLAILESLYSEHGMTYKRRLSAEERAEMVEAAARAKAAERVAALVDRFGPEIVPSWPTTIAKSLSGS